MRRAFRPLTLAVGATLLCAAALAEGADIVTRTSRPVRLLRSWSETIKSSRGQEYVRRVELVFDYGKGVARENYYTLEGRLYGSREIKQNQPAPSAEEIAEAKELIRREPRARPDRRAPRAPSSTAASFSRKPAGCRAGRAAVACRSSF